MGLFANCGRLPLAKREMQGGLIRAARVGSPDWWGGFFRLMAVGLAVSAFLALTGAMETVQWPLWRRFAYWTPLMLITTPIGVLWHPVAERMTLLHGRPLALWLVTAALSALPLCVVVWAFTRWFNGWPMDLVHLPYFYGPTLLVTLAMVGIGMLIERTGAVTHAVAPADLGAPAAAARARFLERLPP
jgi:hypothetical protein